MYLWVPPNLDTPGDIANVGLEKPSPTTVCLRPLDEACVVDWLRALCLQYVGRVLHGDYNVPTKNWSGKNLIYQVLSAKAQQCNSMPGQSCCFCDPTFAQVSSFKTSNTRHKAR